MYRSVAHRRLSLLLKEPCVRSPLEWMCVREFDVLNLQNNLRTGTGGSCGFGPTGITGYPDGAIASVNGSLAIISTEAEKGCGACIQFTCIDAVRPISR